MPLVAAYHRPADLDMAVELVADPARVVLAGGTVLNADRAPSTLEAVDLQACGLAFVEAVGDRLRLGAMTTLDDLRRSPDVPGALAGAARAELPSTLRTLATVGGTVAVADRESLLLAGLLAHDAIVELAPDDARALSDVVADGVPPHEIVLALTVDRSGDTAVAVTGRTPADTPIVAAYARRAADGVRLALCGVATAPVLVDPADPTGRLEPRGDFRGSTDYRLELARVLSARALADLDR